MLFMFVTILLLAGTELTTEHVLWPLSLSGQAFLGFNLIRFLSPSDGPPNSVKYLAGCLIGFFTYSWVYQLLLYIISDVLATWLVANLVVSGTAFHIRRRISVTTSNQDADSIHMASSDVTSSIVIMLGGGFLIVGLSEMRSLIWLGLGLLLAESLKSVDASKNSGSRRMSFLVVSTTFLISAIMAWNLDRPFGKFWFASSNDLQTSVALAVSTSRFGFWDQSRFGGFKDTYHWSVYGWAGMTGPFGDYIVQVAVLAPIIVSGLLFGAGVICIEKITHFLALGVTRRRIMIAAMFASVFLASGLSSYTTQFGMLSVVSFSLLLRDLSFATNSKQFLLLFLALLSAVWANALGIVFLIAVVAVNLTVRVSLRSNQQVKNKMRFIGLSFAMALLGTGAWSLLYLPAARGGSFLFNPFGPRDGLFPVAAQALQFVDPKGRALLFEIVSNQSLLLGAVAVGVYSKLSSSQKVQSLQESIAFGSASVLGLVILRGYEITKFAIWGSFATFVILGAHLIISSRVVTSQNRRERTTTVAAMTLVGLFLFTFGLCYTVAPYLGIYSKKIEILSIAPIVVIGCSLIFRQIAQRRRLQMFSVVVLAFMSIFSFQFGRFSGSYFMESRQRYDQVLSKSNFPYLTLVTDTDVEAVAEFIVSNTPETSLFASNYFCSDGATCPSMKLLEVELPELTPSIWGQNADMSNLAALAQRRFLIQSPRHLFGNYLMPKEAQKRFRLSGEYALSKSGESDLREYGVDYFVLDWHSVISKPRIEPLGTVFTNSRFSVISFNAE